MQITLKCDNCGKLFSVRRSAKQLKERKHFFCSNKCVGEFKKKQTKNNAICAICGKPYHVKPRELRTTKYCSKKCQNAARKIYMRGSGNHQYALKGSDNKSWKSDVRESSYGYTLIRKLDHPFCNGDGFVFEHRLVAEQYLLNNENSVEINGKKYLSPTYVVHHKDFNKQNNSVENLMVMTKRDHSKLHAILNPDQRNGRNMFERNGKKIKIKRVTETAILPERKTDGSVGYDLCVDSDKPIEIQPHNSVIVSTGLAFEIPIGYAGCIYARSGISIKRNIRPSTCVSVIDSDYRGDVMLPMYNDSDEVQIVEPYERVAQLVLHKVWIPEVEVVEELSDTERGKKGFGSTGR